MQSVDRSGNAVRFCIWLLFATTCAAQCAYRWTAGPPAIGGLGGANVNNVGAPADHFAYSPNFRGNGSCFFISGGFSSVGIPGQPGYLVVNHIACWNGAWSSLAGGFATSGAVPATGTDLVIGVVDGDGPLESLYAIGQFTSAGGVAADSIARWDGSAWHPLPGAPFAPAGTFLGSSLNAMAIFNGELYVSGVVVVPNPASPANDCVFSRVMKWSNGAWTQVGGDFDRATPCAVGTTPANVFTFLAFNGSLYAGGRFDVVGGTTCSCVAQWVGSGVAGSWMPVGGGIGSSGVGVVNSFAAVDDGTGPKLFAGGSFSVVNGSTTANNLAKLVGPGWTSVGGSATTGVVVSKMLAYDEDGPGGPASAQLFVGTGNPATTIGGVTADTIARFDAVSHAWSALPGLGGAVGDDGLQGALTLGAGPYVADMLEFDDGLTRSLCVCGSFISAGGPPGAAGAVPAVSVASWSRYAIGFAQSGPGAPMAVALGGLNAGDVHLNLFSINASVPCPPGALTFYGLCFANPLDFLLQVTAPFGTAPITFVAPGGSAFFGPYLIPPGLTIDAQSFDFAPWPFCVSDVTHYVTI